MRVEFVVHSLVGGGAERVAVNLANAFAERGIDVGVTILSPRTEQDYGLHADVEVAVIDSGVPSRGPVDALFRNMERLHRLRGRLNARRPDVTLAIMASASVIVALASLGSGLCVVGCEHNNPPYSLKGPVWPALRRLLYRRLDSVVALTSGAARWIRDNVKTRRVDIIPNAISWPIVDSAPFVDPATVISQERRVILAAGRLVPAKGFDYLIRTFSLVYDRIPAWDLVILGEGPDRGALEAAAVQLGVADRVRLPGRAGNIGAWYRRGDIFAMSSRHEGLPMVLLEAMASGVPPVTWDYSFGPRDIVRPGENGIITPMGDEQALAQALLDLAQDDERRRRIAVAAVNVRETFAQPVIVDEWLKLFASLGARPSDSLSLG